MSDNMVVVCGAKRVVANRGIAALINGVGVAVFLLSDGTLHAIDNTDPISGADVLGRGIVGDVDGEPVVASPMYKQRFSLIDGRCLDREGVGVAVHRAQIVDDMVCVGLGASR